MSELEVIDLRLSPWLIPQYVGVRNANAELLLSKPVGEVETRSWLNSADVEVRCLASDGKTLLGAVILYPEKGGEVAVFVATPGRGLGSRLLQEVEAVAGSRGMTGVWAWVLSGNLPAARAFEKAGFRCLGQETRLVGDVRHEGLRFEKGILEK